MGRCLGSRFAFAEAKASPRVDVDETSQQLSAAADAQQKGSILIRDPENFQVFVHIAGSGARVLWVTPHARHSLTCAVLLAWTAWGRGAMCVRRWARGCWDGISLFILAERLRAPAWMSVT